MKYGLSPGSADIVGIIPPYGRFIAVECKVHPNKVTKSQRAWLSTIGDAGGLAVIAYTLDDIQYALRINESFYRDISSSQDR